MWEWRFFWFGGQPCSIFICVARLSSWIAFSLSHSVFVLTAISRATWFSCCLSKQRMTEVMVTTGAITFKLCKAPVKSSPPTNQRPVFYRPDAPFVAQQTVSKHGWKKNHIPWTCLRKLTWGSSNCPWPLTDPVYLGGGLLCLSSAIWCQYPKHQHWLTAKYNTVATTATGTNYYRYSTVTVTVLQTPRLNWRHLP